MEALVNKIIDQNKSKKKVRLDKFSLLKEMKSNGFLYAMALPGILFFFIFSYIPMFGLLIAFQDFNPVKGIFKSKFVGLDNFKFFFTSQDWIRVTVNTLYLNALFIIIGMAMSILIAIMLSEINRKLFVRITQSIVILPHFISWTVAAMFTVSLFSTDIGVINVILQKLGMSQINFVMNANVWPLTLVIMHIWHAAGFGSIIYLAAISGIDQEMFEAAKIDGASRLQAIMYITLPLLKGTAILLFIMSVGKIFYGNFGMIYAMVGSNPMLYPTTDIIDTYVYRQLMELGYMGMSSAVGFYQSLVGFFIVLITNGIAKKIEPDSAVF